MLKNPLYVDFAGYDTKLSADVNPYRRP